ncbi:glycosyltransferase family 4 protein [Natrarchaeobius oligotrophus]|uniref:Glycosyltransferase family 1 protein n=1 Tax=Natrarchaeobius chitinivorans TaxID=1679083 RepID=A0A3N6MZ61_NATCH|nr:glycosyltransferase family 4 protein [Natrarchaeobius chitinivorans]RQH01802.1 glycosyltransferase family 1 protein [Natrarchaeobius chitinivorans]
MHVGLVVYGGLEETSGGFRYDRRLVAHLERRDDDVEVVALPWRSYPRHLLDGFSPSIRTRLDRPFDVLVQDELCHPSLWRHVDRLDRPAAVVSLVHLLRSGRSERSRHRLDPRRIVDASVERRYLRGVDAAICTSRDTRDRVAELADVPTLVAPPGGRAEGPALDDDRVETRARTIHPLRIAFLGNVIPRKGLPTLLEGLRRADCAWNLTVVGSLETDPAHRESVLSTVRESGLDDRVTLTGEVTDEELEPILERQHVLAVPSTYEGFGMAYLEAMEYGVVPIASAVGGAGEFVEHGRNGYLVEPGAAGAIADIVDRLAANRDELAALGANALETAASHPTWEESMASVRRFLKEQATRKRRDRSSGTPSGGRLERGSHRGDRS